MTRTPIPDPVLGFYGPGSHMWRINREAVLLGAGPAALLLQIAHPLIAEGVAQHSDFERDPFARLRSTLRTTMDMVFGDGPTASRALGRLNGVHATVRGDVTDPAAHAATGASAYRALDPELLLWVQATLIVTSVRAYRHWVGPLSDAETEAFWQEARSLAPRMGIPLDRSPATWPDLMAYWDRMLAPAGPIQVTPTALRLAPTVLRPPFPWVPPAIVDLAGLPGMALVPARIRDAFGIAWTPRHQQLARVLDAGIRLWVRSVPSDWRAMPPARAAERRARRVAGYNRPTASQEPTRA
jgi:uncharacterized protein (DUF2236 family)